MIDSKLVTTLRALTKVEQNRLLKFIESPYHNSNKELLSLTTYILKYLDEPTMLAREKVWRSFQMQAEFDYAKLRKSSSELMKLIEEFMSIDSFSRNRLYMNSFALEAIANRNLSPLYGSATRSAKKIDSQHQYKTSNEYRYSYQIEKSIFKINSFDLKRYKNTNIRDIISNLDKFFTIEKLRYACDILSRGESIESDFLIHEIVNSLALGHFADEPGIQIYHYIYLTLIDFENDNHYFRLRKLISKFSNIFEKNEAKKLYESLVNYSIEKINRGNLSFLYELLNVYKDYLHNELNPTGESIDPFNFKNIITTSLRLKEYEWSEYFIETYKDRLDIDYRQNAYTYHLAQLYFYKKEYGKVLKLLQEVEYDDMSYNIGSKSMLIAIYYETDEYGALSSLFDSFRMYLSRMKSKMPEANRAACLNLIKFTSRLLKIQRGDNKSIDTLLAQIELAGGTLSENWLREKLEELR